MSANKTTRPNSTAANEVSPTIYELIIKTYLDTASIKDTAMLLKLSTVKVRRVLITEKLWSSKTSLTVGRLLDEGHSVKEIAELLCTTEKAVQQYLPYTRGLYMGEARSVAALNSADYRRRIKVVREKTMKQAQRLAEEKEAGAMIKKTLYKGEVVCLHMELVQDDDYYRDEDRPTIVVSQEVKEILHRYGEVRYGESISRDILVPADMPLWALNYAIQKCFGWENSHLHKFSLSDKQFTKITNGLAQRYAELVGVVFRCPCMDVEAEFWNDDYEYGSFNTWLKKKYTGPYRSRCYEEGVLQSKRDMRELRKHYAFRSKEMPVEQIRFMGERDANSLLERLSVGEIFGASVVPSCFEEFYDARLRVAVEDALLEDTPENQPRINCLTDELYYNYDFGDNWLVKLTVRPGAEQLMATGRLTEEELAEAHQQLCNGYRPVCIAQDGLRVLDDVGGLQGFARFLVSVRGDGRAEDTAMDVAPYEDREESLAWAKSLGWSLRKISNSRLL